MEQIFEDSWTQEITTTDANKAISVRKKLKNGILVTSMYTDIPADNEINTS
jgi:hypothetical protein